MTLSHKNGNKASVWSFRVTWHLQQLRQCDHSELLTPATRVSVWPLTPATSVSVWPFWVTDTCNKGVSVTILSYRHLQQVCQCDHWHLQEVCQCDNSELLTPATSVSVCSFWVTWHLQQVRQCDHSELLTPATSVSVWPFWVIGTCNKCVSVIIDTCNKCVSVTILSYWHLQLVCQCDHSELLTPATSVSVWPFWVTWHLQQVCQCDHSELLTPATSVSVCSFWVIDTCNKGVSVIILSYWHLLQVQPNFKTVRIAKVKLWRLKLKR